MKYLIFLCCFLFSTTTLAHPIVGHIAPFPSEYISNHIILPDCPQVKVIEGKSITPNTIQIINKICLIALRQFPVFIQQYDLVIKSPSNSNFIWNLSFLPIDSQYRHLNDSNFRFFTRVKHYSAEGNVIPIYGYTDYHTHISFVMDEVFVNNQLNTVFLIVLTHELYHALSWYYGIYDQYPSNNAEIDERLAVNFVNYIKPWRYF